MHPALPSPRPAAAPVEHVHSRPVPPGDHTLSRLAVSAAPPLSVVMPVFNAQPYVAAAVRSVCQQTFADFEFIIINDGSTDGSLSILQEFAARDRRIRLLDRARTGVVGASNEGIKNARGEFLARMDADDICMPLRFEQQIAYLRAHPDCVGLGASVRMIDSDGDPIRNYVVPTQHEEIDAALFKTWAMFHPTMVARRETVVRLGGYREQFTTLEDLDLMLRLAECGRLSNLPQPLVEYRVHPSSMSNTQTRRMNSIVAEIHRQAYERRCITMPQGAEPPLGPDEFDPDDLAMMWAWWAHDDGYYATARKHALRMLKRRPWDVERWRLLACAVRGQLRQSA